MRLNDRLEGTARARCLLVAVASPARSRPRGRPTSRSASRCSTAGRARPPPWPTSTRTAGSTSSPARTGTRRPRWTKHKFRELGFSNNYIDGFSDLPVDVDGDGYPDIASVTWFAKKISWFRNPGKAGGAWVEAPINAGFNIEFATLADIDNDGKAPEIVAQENGTGQAWYEVQARARGSGLGIGSQGLKTPSPEPRIPSPDFWIKHVVSDRSYGHGIGFGDVNKDGRNDILTPRGWLEAPADPRRRQLDVSPRLGVGERAGHAAAKRPSCRAGQSRCAAARRRARVHARARRQRRRPQRRHHGSRP